MGAQGGSGRRMEGPWGHREDQGEASYSTNRLFQLSQMVHGEALCNGFSSNLYIPRWAGRRNSASATAQRKHTDKVFFRAPLGFLSKGTVRVFTEHFT